MDRFLHIKIRILAQILFPDHSVRVGLKVHDHLVLGHVDHRTSDHVAHSYFLKGGFQLFPEIVHCFHTVTFFLLICMRRRRSSFRPAGYCATSI